MEGTIDPTGKGGWKMRSKRRFSRKRVLLALGGDFRGLVPKWLEEDARVTLVKDVDSALAALRAERSPDAVIIDTHLQPSSRAQAPPPGWSWGAAAAMEVCRRVGFLERPSVVFGLVPEPPGEDGEVLLEDMRATLFAEGMAHEAAEQLRRRWWIFAHGSGLVADITLHQANVLRLSPPSAEALGLLAREMSQEDAAKELGLHLESFKERLLPIKSAAGVCATVLAREIRWEAIRIAGCTHANLALRLRPTLRTEPSDRRSR